MCGQSLRERIDESPDFGSIVGNLGVVRSCLSEAILRARRESRDQILLEGNCAVMEALVFRDNERSVELGSEHRVVQGLFPSVKPVNTGAREGWARLTRGGGRESHTTVTRSR